MQPDARKVGPERLLHSPAGALLERRARSTRGGHTGAEAGGCRRLRSAFFALGLGVPGACLATNFSAGQLADDMIRHRIGLGFQRVVRTADFELGLNLPVE